MVKTFDCPHCNGTIEFEVKTAKPKRQKAEKVWPLTQQVVTPRVVDYASRLGMGYSECFDQIDRMLDHFQAKGEIKKDWQATAMSWLQLTRLARS